jgi:dTMP kinase
LIFIAFEELAKKVIEPKLNENKIVVIDRYIDSTFVYQGLAGGLGVDTIQEVAEKTISIPMPDITFFLDVDPLTAQGRLKKRKAETGEYTNWDKLDLDFHQRVRNYYLELKKVFPNRICIIDASQSEDEVLKEV